MCELLVFVKDRSNTGDPLVDGVAPMQGDVADIREDGAEWGQCERGSPTFTKQNTITVKRSITILLDTKLDAADFYTPGSLNKLKKEDILYSASTQPEALEDVSNAQDGIANVVTDPETNTVRFDEYRHTVISEEDRPISEHPLGNHNFWRIFRIPGVPASVFDNLMEAELPADPQQPLMFPRYRQRYIDKTKIPKVAMKALLDFWNDDTRSSPVLVLNITPKQLQNFVSVRPPIEV